MSADPAAFKVGDRVTFRMFKRTYYGVVKSVGGQEVTVRAMHLTDAEVVSRANETERCDYGARHHQATTEEVPNSYVTLVARGD